MTDFTYSHPSPDSIARDASDKLIEVISVLDFIPEIHHAAIRARTSTVDVAEYVQNAIDFIDSTANGAFYGGQLFFPRGKYVLGATLNLCRGLHLVGEGRVATFLAWTQAGETIAAGTALRMSSTPNQSTGIYLTIRDISLMNSASTPQGAGFWDTAGTNISITRTTFYGFKYGIVLEQSELVDISECDVSGMTHSGIWLVNGGPPSNVHPDFTNRISVRSCQINGCSQFGILDDGGNCHAFLDNNYNGNGVHIRMAVANAVRIAGGEFEAATTNPIQIRAAAFSGTTSGGNSAVSISGCIIAPSGAQSAISCGESSGSLCLVANFFASTGSASVPVVDGLEGVSGFFSIGNAAYLFPGGSIIDAEANDQQVFLEGARHGSAAYDPPSLAAGTSSPVQTMTVNGVAVGDQLESASFSNNLAGAVLHAWVSAANTVSYFFHNLNGANPLDLASGTVRVRVMKRIF
jgi:hypothetical protein